MNKALADKLFEYREGALYWRNTRGTAKAGSQAGTIRKDGRRDICLYGKKYLDYRIIFLMHHGYLPDCIDHIDNDVSNNRIENLRPATIAQNAQNSKCRINSKSGVKGVFLHKATNKWSVSLWVKRVRKYIGLFDTIEEATEAATQARNQYHGEYANHG